MQKSRFSVNSGPSLRQTLSYGGASHQHLSFSFQRSPQKPAVQNEDELILAADSEMQGVQVQMQELCGRSTPILISGEIGSGKTLVAKAIRRSMGADEDCPFVVFRPQDMETSAQSKALFGSSGSVSHMDPEAAEEPGFWQQAYRGMCVIDDISALSLNLQNRLAKFLRDKDARKRGTMQHHEPRLIVMAPSNIDALVEKNKVKLDLFKVFASSHIRIPPLRRRPKDIPHLIEAFLAEHQQGEEKITLSGGAMAMLVNYEWPQNVSELKKVLEVACQKGERVHIQKEDIPLTKKSPEPKSSDNWIQNLPVGQALRVVETHFILETIKAHRGNRTYAARTLGISLRTLRNKINEFTVEGYEVMSPQSGRRSA